MAEYALVDDGEVTWVGPEPDSWENPDGSTTLTPVDTETDPKVLKKLGYIPVEDRDAPQPEGTLQDGYDYEVLKTKVIRSPRYRKLTEMDSIPTEMVPFINAIRAEVARVENEEITALRRELADAHEMHYKLVEEVGALANIIINSEVQSVQEALRDLQQQVRALKRG